MQQGLIGKYDILKTNGTPVDPDAQYFVLRIDTDVHARLALRAYARSVFSDNPTLARDIRRWLLETMRTKAGQEELSIIIDAWLLRQPDGSFWGSLLDPTTREVK